MIDHINKSHFFNKWIITHEFNDLFSEKYSINIINKQTTTQAL